MDYQTYYSLGEVARLLNIPQHRIVYLLQSGQVQESMRLAGRRAFTVDDLVNIAELLGNEKLAELRAMRASSRKETDHGSAR